MVYIKKVISIIIVVSLFYLHTAACMISTAFVENVKKLENNRWSKQYLSTVCIALCHHYSAFFNNKDHNKPLQKIADQLAYELKEKNIYVDNLQRDFIDPVRLVAQQAHQSSLDSIIKGCVNCPTTAHVFDMQENRGDIFVAIARTAYLKTIENHINYLISKIYIQSRAQSHKPAPRSNNNTLEVLEEKKTKLSKKTAQKIFIIESYIPQTK